MPQEPLASSKKHLRICGDRWSKKIHRSMDSADYKEEWYGEQCLGCCYFLPLSGVFAEDWGVCSNPESSFDGLVRYEHDGCAAFDPAESWWSADSQE